MANKKISELDAGTTPLTGDELVAVVQGGATVRVPSSALKGMQGDPGDPGADGAAGLSAYEIAVSEGFVGTEAEWLASLVGPQGETGATGAGLTVLGELADPGDLPPTGDLGDAYLIAGHLWTWNGATWVDAGEIQGPPGADGADGTDGTDGREIEVQKGATHIQWRYVGEATWIDLVALADITGPQGDTGSAGADGADGTDGVDGSSVELQVSATHIQWRLVGASTWVDLVALTTITGPQGEQGETGDTGPAGTTTWAGITDKPAVIAAGATAADARSAIGAIPDAPSDTKTYGRKDGAWAEIIAGGGGVAPLVRVARTSNTQLVAADTGKMFDITSGTFSQTFVAAATLGSGWWCYIANNGTGVVTLDPNSSEQIDGGTTLAMYRGEVRLVQCDGSALRSILVRGRPMFVACDEQASGTAGGSPSPPHTRRLNTVRINTIHGASLVSNQITLPAGVYSVHAVAPANSNAIQGHKAFLYSVTASANLLEGTSGSTVGTSSGNNTHSFVFGVISLTATTVIELRHVTTAAFGAASNLSVPEVYAQIQIEKIA